MKSPGISGALQFTYSELQLKWSRNSENLQQAVVDAVVEDIIVSVLDHMLKSSLFGKSKFFGGLTNPLLDLDERCPVLSLSRP